MDAPTSDLINNLSAYGVGFVTWRETPAGHTVGLRDDLEHESAEREIVMGTDADLFRALLLAIARMNPWARHRLGQPVMAASLARSRARKAVG